MKRLLWVALSGFLLMSCSTGGSDFFAHKSMYKKWDHAKYSWGGYKDTRNVDVEKSEKQDWWGKPVIENDVK